MLSRDNESYFSHKLEKILGKRSQLKWFPFLNSKNKSAIDSESITSMNPVSNRSYEIDYEFVKNIKGDYSSSIDEDLPLVDPVSIHDCPTKEFHHSYSTESCNPKPRQGIYIPSSESYRRVLEPRASKMKPWDAGWDIDYDRILEPMVRII